MTNILAKKAVLTSLHLRYWGARVLDHKITDEVHAEHKAAHDSGRYTKRLVTREMLQPITKAISAAHSYHYSRTQPWLDSGTRLLPSAFFFDYSKTMSGLRKNYEKAADDFCEPRAWAARIDEMAKRLNGMFDPRDYPTASQARKAFQFDMVVMQCPDVDSDFRIALGKEQAEEVRRELAGRMDEVVKGTQRDMAERIVEKVGRMAERLKAYKPAKGKKAAENTFRDSLVENVRELAEMLPAFNMADDKKLAKIIAKINADLCQHDAEKLRDSDSARESVAKSAEQILAQVSEFMA